MDQEELLLTKKQERELKSFLKEEKRIKDQRAVKVKNFLIWALILLSVFGVSIGVFKIFTAPVSTTSETVNITVDQTDWKRGKADAKTQLLEYSDFECPACASYQRDVDKIMEEFKDKIVFIYRHYPLTQIHKNAYPAAILAEAAGLQGKFWEMHDLLFTEQNNWAKENDPKNYFISLSGRLGLDINKLEKDMKLPEIKNKIDNDIKTGDEYGILATPTFFLNGKLLKNINGLDDFRKAISAEVNK